MSKASGRRLRGVLTIGLLSLAGLAAAHVVLPPVTKPPAATAERAAQPVRVTGISFASASRSATYTGTLRPHHEVSLGFRLPGKLIARMVEVGDRVTAGQVIAQLDDTDLRLEVDLAADEVEAARADLDRAEAEMARSKTLFAKGHVAQAAVDRAVSAAAQAVARKDRAGRALDLAQNRLDYAVLRADADGIVTATPAEAGAVVGAGQAIVTLARTGEVDAVFALPEQDRASLATGSATASLWGVSGPAYALKLRDISPDVDPLGRTYRVRMTLAAPDARTVLGRTVTVSVSLSAGAPAAPVPLAAVVNDGTGASVWRLDASGTRVEKVAVEVASIEADVALIRGSLAEGDRIISLGAHKVDPARPVRIVETYQSPDS
jgi:RND family efflux transporter MFP subunit